MKLITILLTFLTTSCLATTSTLPENLESTLDQLINTNKFAGLSLLILKNDGSTFKKHYGYRDLKLKLKPDDNTIYELGSITKAFTRIAIATQDRINLEDSIQTFLPVTTRPPRPQGKDIKIKHLMTHTGIKLSLPCTPRKSGEMKCFGFEEKFDKAAPYKNTTPELNLQFLNEYSYTVEEFAKYFPKPGSYYSYSNLGVGLLGNFLADQFQTTYEEYLKQHVLSPLRMHDTQIEMTCEKNNTCKNLAKVYVIQNQKPHWSEKSLWHIKGLAAAGGLRSNLKDMHKFLKANLIPEKDRLI